MRLLMRELKSDLSARIKRALERAGEDGLLPRSLRPEGAVLTVPKDRAHGDLSSNAALVTASKAGMPPRRIAEIILSRLDRSAPVSRVECAGPGFINFYLTPAWREEAIGIALDEGADYGRVPDFDGRRMQIEFVSANPVGPLNVVNARAGALGDCLAALLQFAGAEVEREYYVNDHGLQVTILGRSVEARCRELTGREAEFPEDGYQGDYIYDIAREFLAQAPSDFWSLPEEERGALCRDFALERILAGQKADLGSYGVHYDRWFSERLLHESGAVSAAFRKLIEAGHTYEQEGAVWLRTTDFGDDKDRVLETSDGRTTYLLADIAYHLDKFSRGFDRVIDIWGPDHHGHVLRMQASLAAAGSEPGRLEILIAQQINLLRKGEPVKMSKRAGNFITMTELLSEVGNDAARFFFLMRSPESHLDFDLALAVEQSNENPVFYIQYAYARVASILRQAKSQGIELSGGFPGGRLQAAEDLALADEVAAFPDVVAEAAALREPHRLTGYLLNLAGLFHGYYNKYRILTDDAGLSSARLALAGAVQRTVGNGLRLLGVSAPEKM